MRLHDLPVHKKPREKLLLLGPENLKDEELLAIILRTGYKGKHVLELSQYIIKHYPLSSFLTKSHKELSNIKGIGKAKAAEIAAIQELIHRHVYTTKPKVQSSEDIYKLVFNITKKKQEYLVTVLLNARNEVLSIQTISIGTLTANLVHPREVFAPAVKHRAAAVVIVHNHPSGDTTPSSADISTTQRLVMAGEVLGIEVLDHIIVGKSGYQSIIKNK